MNQLLADQNALCFRFDRRFAMVHEEGVGGLKTTDCGDEQRVEREHAKCLSQLGRAR